MTQKLLVSFGIINLNVTCQKWSSNRVAAAAGIDGEGRFLAGTQTLKVRTVTESDYTREEGPNRKKIAKIVLQEQRCLLLVSSFALILPVLLFFLMSFRGVGQVYNLADTA